MDSDKEATIQVFDLVKTYQGLNAVDHLSFSAKKGEILTFLGPSGCGKTTTLRIIAGFERPDAGEVYIDGKLVSSPEKGVFVQPERRNVGLVFQSYALFPHMTIWDNITYGLKSRKFPADEIRARASDWINRLGLDGKEKRYPSQLSGGEQQRVALGRCLVYEPKTILLDEPLSNLDRKVRERLRYELRALLRTVGVSVVYVTHDQDEAFILSDRIMLMNKGKVVQVGRPEEIYGKPHDEFVAGFIGRANLYHGTASRESDGTFLVSLKELKIDITMTDSNFTAGPYHVLLRPDEIQLVKHGDAPNRNDFEGIVSYKGYRGSTIDLHIRMGDSELVLMVQRLAAPPGLDENTGVRVHIPEEAVTLVPLSQVSETARP